MREIQASEAKAHFSSLLDDIERGETLVIKRHGKAVARIVPEGERRQEEIDRAVARIRAIRQRTQPVSIEEILAMRDEGRK